jgi:hypothetical protein
MDGGPAPDPALFVSDLPVVYIYSFIEKGKKYFLPLLVAVGVPVQRTTVNFGPETQQTQILERHFYCTRPRMAF